MNPLAALIPAMLPALAFTAQADGASPWGQIALAIGLLAAALVLLVLEFFLVSLGLFAIAAFACALAACGVAFAASPAVGWTLVAITPVFGVLVVRWGLARLQRSRLVPQAEITGDSGYRHAADLIGVGVGSIGELVTDAFPTGRARFAGAKASGELDVMVQGAVLKRGDRVVVLGIAGAVVLVRAASDAPLPPAPNATVASAPSSSTAPSPINPSTSPTPERP